MARSAILLYEPRQVAHLDALVARAGTDAILISFDAEIDALLSEQRRVFLSARTLESRGSVAAYEYAETLAKNICESNPFASLTHRNVALMEPLRCSITVYFETLLYHLTCIKAAIESVPDVTRCIIPRTDIPLSAGVAPMAIEESQAFLDAAQLIAEDRGIGVEAVDVYPVVARAGVALGENWFRFKRTLFGGGLAVLNALNQLRPRKRIRILASDYWRYISPIIEQLPEAELILLDRTEALQINFSTLWKHRMRFVHADAFMSKARKQRVQEAVQMCQARWGEARPNAFATIDTAFEGLSLRPLCIRMCSTLIERDLPRAIEEVEATHAMCESLIPDVVLLRASVSRQLHFGILPLVARELNIPSLEVQHGIAYLGPGSAERIRAAEYLATYGPLVSEEFVESGYESRRLLSVGSPRFDIYARQDRTQESDGSFSALCIIPPIAPGIRYDTYDIEELVTDIGTSFASVPNAEAVIAWRERAKEGFIAAVTKRALVSVRYRIPWMPSLPSLLPDVDVVICHYSTIVYEAMVSGKPVVMPAYTPIERLMVDFHFARFVEAGALIVAHSRDEFAEALAMLARDSAAREQMGKAAQRFMDEQFLFDGKAAQRIAEHVRTWKNA